MSWVKVICQKNTPLICACLDNSEHIQWMEIEGEVPKNSEQVEYVGKLKEEIYKWSIILTWVDGGFKTEL